MSSLIQEHITDPGHPLVAELAERQYRWRIRFRYADESAGRAAASELVAGLLPDSRLVRTRGGFLWLGPGTGHTGHTPVFDVAADDVSDVPALRDLAAGLAAAPLGPSVVPGEPALEAFVADGSFRLAATHMRLDVTGALPGEELADRVEVVPMSDDEASAVRRDSVATYARTREEAGESPELARSIAEASFTEMFPGGRPKQGDHHFTVLAGGARAGVLWVAARWPAQAWVYNVEIDPALRGRGLGAAAMVCAARWTREQGVPWLGLNVFGPNRHARALYGRLGYVVEEEHYLREG